MRLVFFNGFLCYFSKRVKQTKFWKSNVGHKQKNTKEEAMNQSGLGGTLLK